MKTQREAETQRLIAGILCLDFTNTLNGHNRRGGHEYLHDYRDLVLWSRHAGLLTARETSRALQQGRSRPRQAEGAYRRAIRLREMIFRIFRAVAQEREPRTDDLLELSAAWKRDQSHAYIVRAASGFSLGWDDETILEMIPRRLCASAVDLLTSGRLPRVRACSGDGCDWLFVDDSRNHLRRWCSMDECGNRAKMRRRQARKLLAGVN